MEQISEAQRVARFTRELKALLGHVQTLWQNERDLTLVEGDTVASYKEQLKLNAINIIYDCLARVADRQSLDKLVTDFCNLLYEQRQVLSATRLAAQTANDKKGEIDALIEIGILGPPIKGFTSLAYKKATGQTLNTKELFSDVQ